MTWNTLYVFDLISIAIFAISYYRNCYLKGYRADFWHAQLFFHCIFPYMFMLFFVKSELNAVIVGPAFAGIVETVPRIFPIVLAGYAAILAGGGCWRLRVGLGVRTAVARTLALGPRCSVMLMSSCDLLVCLSLLCLFLQTLILGTYFAQEGFAFNLRAYTFSNPGIRPFAQVTALSSIIIASHCLARYLDTKERILLSCTLLLTFGLIFFGQRGDLLSIYVNIALCYLIRLRSRVGLLRILSLVTVLVMAGLYLGNVREGAYALGEFFASLAFLFLYGNNFTDLRDFAWVFSDWNHHLWLGRTYLAGLATFVPRGASAFRATWTFGVATGWTVGLDTDVHPGLKPGLFAESFLNFGWLGVLAASFIFGVILRRVDVDVKAALDCSHPSMMKAFSSTMLLTVAACFSSSLGIPFLYAFCGIYLFAWVYLQLQALVQHHGPSNTNDN